MFNKTLQIKLIEKCFQYVNLHQSLSDQKELLMMLGSVYFALKSG